MTASREERRVVTALFADIAGSTQLTERHGAEEARLIVGEAIARAVRIVDSYGGTVKDLAGDGMLALFGAPTAHEDDPERALRAGLEIAAAIADYAGEVQRGWGVDGFGVRLGVETGDVVVGDVGAGSRIEYGATGDAVNVAARLQSLADAGSVLVGPRARRLTDSTFEFGAPSELSLKGKAEAVEAAPLRGLRSGSPAPRTTAPLVGRDRELGELTGALEALAGGRGGIVFVSGEPGIGKSRLFAELHEAAASRAEVDWLEGRGVSYGAALAWWPVRDLLRVWLGVGPQDPELRARVALRRRLDELGAPDAPRWTPFLEGILGLSGDPAAESALAGLSPEALQFQSFEVVAELLTAMTARRPLVFAIDDLHWADATTIGLLERLLRLAESVPVLFLLNHRPETAHASWGLRERAQREYRHLLRLLDLPPLSHDDERRLLAAVSEGALTAEVEARVLEYADGNPLFLEEMARGIGEVGPGGAAGVPRTLDGAILARLDRLEPAWRDVLTSAAVCGRTFSQSLVAAVAGVAVTDLRPAVHNLLRLDLLVEERRLPEPAYRFKHALVQEAAYRTLLAGRRRELHARAAAWFEGRPEGESRVNGLLAHHWLEADDLERAAPYLALAGQEALNEWALDEAAGHLRALVSVLERAGRPEAAARPLFQLASTLHLAMRFGEANDAWRRASELWQAPARATEPPVAKLVLGVNQVPWSADPFSGIFAANLRLVEQLDDALFALRPGPCIEPRLAGRIEVDDRGLRYRIHLREDLRYGSEASLDAPRVVENLRRFLRRSGDASILWVVGGARAFSESRSEEVSIRAHGDAIVEFELDRPDPAFHIHLAQPHLGVTSGQAGAGPFVLREMSDDRVRIELNPEYDGTRTGNVASVEWLLKDPDDAAAGMESGELDAVVYYPNLARQPRGDFVEAIGEPLLTIGLRPTRKGPAVDQALRRALALGLDRERLVAHLGRHQVVATGGLVPPGLPGHTPGVAPPFDPDAARRALAESRHEGPLRVGHFAESRYATVIAAVDCWRDVLRLDVEAVPIAMRDAWKMASAVHVLQFNWLAHVPDPAYFLNNLLHTGSRSNTVGVSDPELDRRIDEAMAEPDGRRRMQLFHEADRFATGERNLVIPIVYGRATSILQPWVANWWEWGNPNQLFSEVVVGPDSPRAHG